jgi:hypothetical protein
MLLMQLTPHLRMMDGDRPPQAAQGATINVFELSGGRFRTFSTAF